MVRPNHRVMFAIHLVKPNTTTHEISPVAQFSLPVLIARTRYYLERLAVENIHVRHGARRVVLPADFLQRPRYLDPRR